MANMCAKAYACACCVRAYVRALCVYASVCVCARVHVLRVLCESAMRMRVRVLREDV